jgi:hypothetical protein
MADTDGVSERGGAAADGAAAGPPGRGAGGWGWVYLAVVGVFAVYVVLLAALPKVFS